jgi:hypothetical protein
MQEISVIKIPSGCVVNKNESGWLFDGEKAASTYMSSWWRLNKVPEHIVRMYTKHTNERWELKYDVTGAAKIIADSEARYWDGDKWLWYNPDLAPLYNYACDLVEVQEEIEFSLKDLGTITDFIDSGSIAFPEKEIPLTALEHHLVDKIFVPEPILLNERPCEIPDYKLYPILRAYLRKHLDYGVVELKDWDDSLTVDKIIILDKPEPHQSTYTPNGNKRKKPKVEYRTTRKVRVYAIYVGQRGAINAKYGHEPLQPIAASSPKELEAKIHIFLTNLVTDLNTPLKDCPYCSGKGVIVPYGREDK